MALIDDCDVIDANPLLTAAEKARDKATAKATGIRAALVTAWTFPKIVGFSRNGAVYSFTITSVAVQTPDTGVTLLVVNGSATKDGVLLRNADGTPLFPLQWYNPPCLLAGGTDVTRDGRSFGTDVVALMLALLSDEVSTGVRT